MRHIAKLSGVFAALAITTAPVYSRDQSKVLDEIATFAERVCQTTPVKSKTEELQLSGKANAEFKGLLSKLAALGVGGAATYNKAESEGVLQKDLAGLLGKSTDCRQKITEKLIDKLLTSRSLDKTDSKIVNAPEKTTSQLTSPSIVVLSDFNAYEMQRRTLGNSYQFFKINGPLRYRTWLSEAEHGNAMAQVLVGRALDVGAGVIEDKVELAKWFQRKN